MFTIQKLKAGSVMLRFYDKPVSETLTGGYYATVILEPTDVPGECEVRGLTVPYTRKFKRELYDAGLAAGFTSYKYTRVKDESKHSVTKK